MLGWPRGKPTLACTSTILRQGLTADGSKCEPKRSRSETTGADSHPGVNTDLPKLWFIQGRDYAARRLRVLLQLYQLWITATAQCR